MNQEKTPSVESIHPFDPAQFPEARSRGTASRDEIRSTTHRVMGSRISAKPMERSNQQRQPKTGGTGHHYPKPGTAGQNPSAAPAHED